MSIFYFLWQLIFFCIYVMNKATGLTVNKSSGVFVFSLCLSCRLNKLATPPSTDQECGHVIHSFGSYVLLMASLLMFIPSFYRLRIDMLRIKMTINAAV